MEEVYLEADEILAHAKEGAYVIDMTTTSPRLSKRIYEEAKKKSVKALDAPVSGGDLGAKNGTLAIMVGGDRADYDACQEIFKAMGTNIVYEGEAGTGQHVKMANQIAIAGALAGVCEAVKYGEATMLDLETMINTITGGAAGSWQLSNQAPKMIVEDYSAGFFLKHFVKDMQIAIDEAESRGVEFLVLKSVHGMCSELVERGHVEDGTQVLVEYYKRSDTFVKND